MKLNTTPRQGIRKNEAKEMRRAAAIPAILYTSGRPCEPLSVPQREFKAHLRTIKEGRLPTTVFTLVQGGKERRVLIKDIQYAPTDYEVIHLDFQELLDKIPIRVNVPIQCIGAADCNGVKLGGIFRQIIRTVKVECLPKDMPAEFVMDVRDLGIMQSKRLRDIAMPQGVRPLARLEEVVVVVGKR